MATDKLSRENLVHVDDKGRVVLPRAVRRAELYAVEVMDNDDIILRPRVAVDPRSVISKKTLAILDESMENLTKGKAGPPIDLGGFSGEDDTTNGQESEAKRKRARRR